LAMMAVMGPLWVDEIFMVTLFWDALSGQPCTQSERERERERERFLILACDPPTLPTMHVP